MVEDKNSSMRNKTDPNYKNDSEKTKREKEEKNLDSYDRVLLDTFPASDAVAKY